jgi:hypothetical protein
MRRKISQDHAADQHVRAHGHQQAQRQDPGQQRREQGVETGDPVHDALPRAFGAQDEGVALAHEAFLHLLRALLEIGFHIAGFKHAAHVLQIGAELAVGIDQAGRLGGFLGGQPAGIALEGAVGRNDALARLLQRRGIAGIALRDAGRVAAQVGAGRHQGQRGGIHRIDLLRGKAVELRDVFVGLPQAGKAHAAHEQLEGEKYRDDSQ